VKKVTVWVATFAFLAVGAAMFLSSPTQRAQAQSGSLSFHGLIEDQLLVPDLLLRTGDDWGGYIEGYLGDEFLPGKVSGNDGTVTWHRWVGMGKDGSMYFDFGGGNTFITVASQATFPNPPGMFPAGGMYHGAHKIASGTGRFAHASGNLLIRGPYIVWDLDKPLPQGRFDAEVTGNISGVQ
jgi:hypothetical protein